MKIFYLLIAFSIASCAARHQQTVSLKDPSSGALYIDGKVYGSYLEFIEFNGVRYWDIRENIPINSIDVDNKLKSSSNLRLDKINLELSKKDII